jgi:hypothetical protein
LSELVRIRKTATREGRQETIEDGHVVEGEELQAPECGQPYAVRRTVMEQEDAPDVFFTSPVRAVVKDKDGGIVLMTDNSRYVLEMLGR